jgi:hypothetical protein
MTKILNYINENYDNDNIYDIFCEIYINKNNKFYDTNEREYYKNYLILIFDELYDIDINLDDITKLLEKNNKDGSRIEQDNFRKRLIDKYGKCIITGENETGCEAAHINDLKDEPLNYDTENGLLLNRTLHNYFDKLYWCINPKTMKIEVNPKYANDFSISINKYNGKYMRDIIKLNDLTYLEKKYKKFKLGN